MAAVTNIIPAYLYVQYNDDPGLQALVKAYNVIAQNYLDTLNDLNLYNYTQDPVSGALLDWIAQGFFGFQRPVLPTLPVNDDLFRRVITWHYFKGDGLVFNIRWLKRRIQRFLYGVNGIDPPVDVTYRVSVLLDGSSAVTIRIVNNLRTVIGGAFPGAFQLNTKKPDQIDTTNVVYPTIPEAAILQQAMQSGILETPFQFNFTVIQSGIAQYILRYPEP